MEISNSLITSPISGTVTNRNINVGEMTSPNSPLMTIADTTNLKFEGNASQNVIVLMKVGEPVRVMVDGMAGPGYEGKVSQVGPIAAATGQYFPVAIDILNDGKLFAGMTAKAEFPLTSQEGVVIPDPPWSPTSARPRSSSSRGERFRSGASSWAPAVPPMSSSFRACRPATP